MLQPISRPITPAMQASLPGVFKLVSRGLDLDD